MSDARVDGVDRCRGVGRGCDRGGGVCGGGVYVSSVGEEVSDGNPGAESGRQDRVGADTEGGHTAKCGGEQAEGEGGEVVG